MSNEELAEMLRGLASECKFAPVEPGNEYQRYLSVKGYEDAKLVLASVVLANFPSILSALKDVDVLREALEKIRDRARALRKGTDDWFELVEFECAASQALQETER